MEDVRCDAWIEIDSQHVTCKLNKRHSPPHHAHLYDDDFMVLEVNWWPKNPAATPTPERLVQP